MITKKLLDIDALKAQLQEGEQLQFLFASNSTPIDKTYGGERVNCKNGHFNFISNYMGFEPNCHVQIKCNECNEIIFEFKPYAVRNRELNLIELSPAETHKTNECQDYNEKQ